MHHHNRYRQRHQEQEHHHMSDKLPPLKMFTGPCAINTVRVAGIRDLKADEQTCFVVVMPAHIDAVLGKLLAAVGSPRSQPPPGPAFRSRLLRTKLFRPQPVSWSNLSASSDCLSGIIYNILRLTASTHTIYSPPVGHQQFV